MATDGCPVWCLGGHSAAVEHHSARALVGGLLVEVIQYPGDERVYLSLLEPHDGGSFFVLPTSVVPLIATTALSLTGAPT